MRTNIWIFTFLFLFGGCADTHYRAQEIVATLDKQPVVSQQLSDARLNTRIQKLNESRRTPPAASSASPAVQSAPVAAPAAKPIYVPQAGSRVLKKVEYDAQITPSQSAAYYALLIGIDRYPHFTPLETAVRDVNALDELLRREYGFQTVVIRNDEATRENIVEAINAFRKKLTQHDKFLIYYAGHGHFDKETDGSPTMPHQRVIPTTLRPNRSSRPTSNGSPPNRCWW